MKVKYPIFLLTGVIIILSYYFIDKQLYTLGYSPINNQISYVKMKPAGEIVQDFYIEQSIGPTNNVSSLDNEPICLSLLMANYSNRRNKGSFAMGIKTRNKNESFLVNATSIKDNKYFTKCFKNISIQDIQKSDNAKIFLKGVDGMKGSSVTAWSTDDTSAGNIAGESNRSLLYSLKTKKTDKYYSVIISCSIAFINILLLLCPLLIPIMFKGENKNGLR
jgi:virulence-associated protein VapD